MRTHFGGINPYLYGAFEKKKRHDHDRRLVPNSPRCCDILNPSRFFLFFRFVLFCFFYFSVRFVPLNLSNFADMISEEQQASRLGVGPRDNTIPNPIPEST